VTAGRIAHENEQALEQRSRMPFDEWRFAAPGYRGFVDVAIDGCPPFVMFCNDDDNIAKSYLYKGSNAFEGESLRLWAQLAKSHDLIFDVGAFTGIYSLAAAAVNPKAKILAIEPASNSFHRMATNVLANGFSERVGCIQIALGDRRQTLDLHHPDGIYVLGSGESLLPNQPRRSWYCERVEVMRADALPKAYASNPRPFVVLLDVSIAKLVKIDVEGFETKVLKGFGKLLRRNLPTFLVECFGMDQLQSVRRVLKPFSYQSRFIDDLNGVLHQDEERFKANPANVLFWACDPAVEKLVQSA
jgi:FkbM family methyltransferase